ncbi:MAG: hypothetical protein A3J83_00815 [Elusimicrobia bacterium RIFOXYA2_FULL_40_6]|nr:MAG: hypothetical protein A3J83_00815 [Elusimicrobia bacterium RIFOXYA2_FULL_40_6]
MAKKVKLVQTAKELAAFNELKKTLQKLVDKRKPIKTDIYKLTVHNVKTNTDIKELFIPSENMAVSIYQDLNVFRTDSTRYKHAKKVKTIGIPRDFIDQLKVYLEPKDKIKEIIKLHLEG